jgi:hypothetical protein
VETLLCTFFISQKSAWRPWEGGQEIVIVSGWKQTRLRIV